MSAVTQPPEAEVTLEQLANADPDCYVRWYRYFQRKGFKVDLTFESMRAALLEHGGTETLTRSAITKAIRDPDWPTTWISGLPSKDGDIRHSRPYFMVPLMETAELGEQGVVLDEIEKYVRSLPPDQRPDKIICLSHGWHRNYFDAVTTYDRLISRFFVLSARDRIKPVVPPPLFIALHWHSDPGTDGWADHSGRRHRASFIELARQCFEPRPGSAAPFLNDFENLFVAMATLSAPDASEAAPPKPYPELNSSLQQYDVRDAQTPIPDATAQGMKISLLWRCYAESVSKGLHADQDIKAEPFGSPWLAVSTLLKFATGAFGILWLAEGLTHRALAALSQLDWWKNLWSPAHAGGSSLAAAAILGVACTAVLALSSMWLHRGLSASVPPGVPRGVRMAFQRSQRSGRSAKSAPVLQAAAWLPLQVLLLLPLVCYLVVTWILRTSLALVGLALVACPWVIGKTVQIQLFGRQMSLETLGWLIVGLSAVIATYLYNTNKPVKGLFDERLKHRGDRSKNMRDHLAAIARFPINLCKKAITADSALLDTLRALDNQFAFFQMQHRGVDAGQDAGRFLKLVLKRLEDLEFDVSFVGHSFGGLVIANAAREAFTVVPPGEPSPFQFARKRWRAANIAIRNLNRSFLGSDVPEVPTNARLCSIAFLQAALASGWFKNEARLSSAGKLACVYSKYDTANGFWYPLANNGRLAMGYVGMCDVPGVKTLGKHGEFVMLNQPPFQVIPAAGTGSQLLNIDASRLIYEGALLTGGGHDDIFKDDVLHLLWACIG